MRYLCAGILFLVTASAPQQPTPSTIDGSRANVFLEEKKSSSIPSGTWIFQGDFADFPSSRISDYGLWLHPQGYRYPNGSGFLLDYKYNRQYLPFTFNQPLNYYRANPMSSPFGGLHSFFMLEDPQPFGFGGGASPKPASPPCASNDDLADVILHLTDDKFLGSIYDEEKKHIWDEAQIRVYRKGMINGLIQHLKPKLAGAK